MEHISSYPTPCTNLKFATIGNLAFYSTTGAISAICISGNRTCRQRWRAASSAAPRHTCRTPHVTTNPASLFPSHAITKPICRFRHAEQTPRLDAKTWLCSDHIGHLDLITSLSRR
eukprot:3933432-Rhodomonas_salina.4